MRVDTHMDRVESERYFGMVILSFSNRPYRRYETKPCGVTRKAKGSLKQVSDLGPIARSAECCDFLVTRRRGGNHGWVISSGFTAASNSSPVSRPSAMADSRKVLRSLCAFFATLAALS